MGDLNKEDAYKNLEMVNFWIENVDTKISYGLALSGALLAFVFSSDKTTELIQNSIKALGEGRPLILFDMVALVGFIGFSITAIIYLIHGLRATVDPDVFKESGLDTKSKIFWGTIAKKGYAQYKQEIDGVSNSDILNDINSQMYINSKICDDKFANYNKGIDYLLIAIVALAVFKVLSYFV